MNSFYAACLAACVTLFLTGCYESSVPLAEPDAATFDASLQGTWVPVAPDADSSEERVWVTAFNDREYYVEMCCDEDWEAEDGRARFRAYLTAVDGARFINLQALTEPLEERSFFFYRLTVESDSLLMLQGIPNDALADAAPATSAELLAIIRARHDDPALYDDEPVRLRRVED